MIDTQDPAWLAVAGPRTILLAGPRSFCAGVVRAIDIVERLLLIRGGPVYVRKQIVHNAHVVADLESRGAVFVEDLDEIPHRSTVVFSAHGVSPSVRERAVARELDVVDATCPLVTKVHIEARRFAGRGDTIILIGHQGHEEVEGTLGELGEQGRLVGSIYDAQHVEVPDPERVSYLTQTTLGVHETANIIAVLRTRFPRIEGPPSDDICFATTNRQNALMAVADEADLVLVLGSTNSSNSTRLVELGRESGTPAHLIDDVDDIDAGWLTGVNVIALTAGASAPPHLITEVIDGLRGLGPVDVRRRDITVESVRFALPASVRTRGGT